MIIVESFVERGRHLRAPNLIQKGFFNRQHDRLNAPTVMCHKNVQEVMLEEFTLVLWNGFDNGEWCMYVWRVYWVACGRAHGVVGTPNHYDATSLITFDCKAAKKNVVSKVFTPSELHIAELGAFEVNLEEAVLGQHVSDREACEISLAMCADKMTNNSELGKLSPDDAANEEVAGNIELAKVASLTLDTSTGSQVG